MKKLIQDPNFEQTVLIDVPKRPKGRPEYGRKLVGGEGKAWADNQRKSRSVWSTSTENELLKQILDVIKYEKNYERITLGDILKDFMEHHVGSRVEEGEINPVYFQGRYYKINHGIKGGNIMVGKTEIKKISVVCGEFFNGICIECEKNGEKFQINKKMKINSCGNLEKIGMTLTHDIGTFYVKDGGWITVDFNYAEENDVWDEPVNDEYGTYGIVSFNEVSDIVREAMKKKEF